MGPGKAVLSRVSKQDYFSACKYDLFRVPVSPTQHSIDMLMKLLLEDDGKDGDEVRNCQFFQFRWINSDSSWNPEIYTRLAYEGFIINSAPTGQLGEIEPLPELQPYYSVITWNGFRKSRRVRKVVKRLSSAELASVKAAAPSLDLPDQDASQSPEKKRYRYKLIVGADMQRTWERLQKYHGENKSNWLTAKYFETIKAASASPLLNFHLHCIEMFLEDNDGNECELVAGEIGYTIGKIYTSLSGWISKRVQERYGTIQMVLLGFLLEKKGYKLWSLGHCYSPDFDYKLELGGSIYTREDFLSAFRLYRGSNFAFFNWLTQNTESDESFEKIEDGVPFYSTDVIKAFPLQNA